MTAAQEQAVAKVITLLTLCGVAFWFIGNWKSPSDVAIAPAGEVASAVAMPSSDGKTSSASEAKILVQPVSKRRPEDATSPTEFVALTIASDRAAPETKIIGKKVIITYSTDPWALTTNIRRSSFMLTVVDLVPAMFRKFPEVRSVEIHGTATFHDVKGNEKVKDVAWVLFDRANSDTIKWDAIDIENIPIIADRHWTHPALYKD